MLTRAIRSVSLPMLALLLALPAAAHASALSEDDASSNCSHDRDAASGKSDLPPFAPASGDQDSAQRFSATRTLSPVPAAASLSAHIAVCRASVTLTPSPDGLAHLIVELSKPLPGGQSASHVLRGFLARDGAFKVEIDAPAGTGARIQLALPPGIRTELALVRGDLDVTRLLGNTQIAIVKGNASLHVADSDFATLECATILGGIRDHRPNGNGNHGHMLATWTGHGSGTAKIEFSAISGDLILLPPAS